MAKLYLINGRIFYEDTDALALVNGRIHKSDTGAAAGTTVTATTGALSLASVTATISAAVSIVATTAALTFSPVNATVSANTQVTATTGALTLAPVDAQITALERTDVTATTGALTLAPVDATVNASKLVRAGITPELLSNGSMEDGTTGWTVDPTSTIEVETGTVNTGSKSIKFTRGASGSRAFEQSITTVIGKRYNISGYVYLETGANAGYLYAGSSSFNTGLLLLESNTVGSWVKLSGTFTATTTTSFIGYSLGADTSDVIYCDDASVTLVDALALAPVNATITLGADTNVTATTGALSLSAQDTTVNDKTSVNATTGALSLSPVNSTITLGADTNVTATTGALTIAPVDAQIADDLTVYADSRGAEENLDSDLNTIGDWTEVGVFTLTATGVLSATGMGLFNYFGAGSLANNQWYEVRLTVDSVNGSAFGLYRDTGFLIGNISAPGSYVFRTFNTTQSAFNVVRAIGTGDAITISEFSWKQLNPPDISLAPVDADITLGTSITATTAALSLASVDADISAATGITATTGALSLSPVNATITLGGELSVTATTGSMTFAPVKASIDVYLPQTIYTAIVTTEYSSSITTEYSANITTEHTAKVTY